MAHHFEALIDKAFVFPINPFPEDPEESGILVWNVLNHVKGRFRFRRVNVRNRFHDLTPIDYFRNMRFLAFITLSISILTLVFVFARERR